MMSKYKKITFYMSESLSFTDINYSYITYIFDWATQRLAALSRITFWQKLSPVKRFCWTTLHFLAGILCIAPLLLQRSGLIEMNEGTPVYSHVVCLNTALWFFYTISCCPSLTSDGTDMLLCRHDAWCILLRLLPSGLCT